MTSRHGCLAIDERLGGRENLVDQLRVGGFAVDAQQRLGSGTAQQHPWLGPVVVLGNVEEELVAVHVFHAQHLVSDLGGRSAARLRAEIFSSSAMCRSRLPK